MIPRAIEQLFLGIISNKIQCGLILLLKDELVDANRLTLTAEWGVRSTDPKVSPLSRCTIDSPLPVLPLPVRSLSKKTKQLAPPRSSPGSSIAQLFRVLRREWPFYLNCHIHDYSIICENT
ncbi:hypothetical protein MA16_Dca005266 [Dendrobium catenatum]|uniref:Uncharacterized protein n=1 Tax=Dendrobium catenatum TaxID=906689 RepID=A0A2I0VLT6_9ASPA|nr:hypothetical protein MA16_Dca005266 [Dendrobium catenatum]